MFVGCNAASKIVVQFSFGFLFVVFLASCLLKLECFVCCFLSEKHNRCIIYLDIVLFFVVHHFVLFDFFSVGFVLP